MGFEHDHLLRKAICTFGIVLHKHKMTISYSEIYYIHQTKINPIKFLLSKEGISNSKNTYYIKSHFLLEVHFYPFWISYHCRNNGRLFFRFLPRKYGASFFAKSCLRYDFVMVTIMPPTPNSKCQTISNNTWRFSLHIKWLVWPMWKCLK